MNKLQEQIGSAFIGGAIGYGITVATSVGSVWIKIGIVITTGILGAISVLFDFRNTSGPVQVFLPKWDGEDSNDDFCQDGVIQWKGFKRAEQEAATLRKALKVDYNKMEKHETAEDLLRKMKEHHDKGSRFFIMTMSSKVEEILGGFQEWHGSFKTRWSKRKAPILIVTVASAPHLADVKNGVVRWYIRSDEESEALANKLERHCVKAAAFCITRTAGSADDSYGVQGFAKFCAHFDHEIPMDFVKYVTASNAEKTVKEFLGRFKDKKWPGVFVIGYGKMIKNTIAALISEGYDGCIVCTSTLTDPTWRPSAAEIARAKAQIFTVLPRLVNARQPAGDDNHNVVFFFARKTLLRVLKLTCGRVDSQTFLERWMRGDDDGPEKIMQDYLHGDGDILVKVRVVKAQDLK